MQNRIGLFVLAFVFAHAHFAFSATDIEIVAPRGGETYLAGQTQYIRLASTTKFKVIQIELSRDGGATFTPLGSINNTGDASKRNLLAYSVQGPASVNCQIRATATQGKTTANGLSGAFYISVAGGGGTMPTGPAGGDLTGTYPSPQIANGAVTNAKVNSGAASSNFVLAADGNGGANWTPAQSVLPTVGAPYVLKAGDTMTGLLTLSGNPSNALHAAPKQYVDTETTRATTAEGTKIAKAGDTMSGLLTLSGDPIANLHAATKQYVDAGNATQNATIAALPIAPIYGDGNDGDVVISVDTLLSATGDFFYNNLTVNPGVTLKTNGQRLFIRNTCTINGTIANNGDSGVASTPGGGGRGRTIGNGGSGGNGLSGGGQDAGGIGNTLGGKGGAGGSVNGAAGGQGGPLTVVADLSGGASVLRAFPNSLTCRDLDSGKVLGGSGGGGGGGNSPGGGGGGGGVVMIAARLFAGTGTIQARGGNGASVAGGGGGGGGGGVIVTVSTNSPTAAGITLDVSGGTGGTSVNGGVGTNGNAGNIFKQY